jgi:hypothetical protein
MVPVALDGPRPKSVNLPEVPFPGTLRNHPGNILTMFIAISLPSHLPFGPPILLPSPTTIIGCCDDARAEILDVHVLSTPFPVYRRGVVRSNKPKDLFLRQSHPKSRFCPAKLSPLSMRLVQYSLGLPRRMARTRGRWSDATVELPFACRYSAIINGSWRAPLASWNFWKAEVLTL